MAKITNKEIHSNLLGAECLGCGGKKLPRASFCRRCYRMLPVSMRRMLYQQFPAYYKNVREALEKLTDGTFKENNHTGHSDKISFDDSGRAGDDRADV